MLFGLVPTEIQHFLTMSYLSPASAMLWVVALRGLKSKLVALSRRIYDCCRLALVDSGVCLRVREQVLKDQSFDHGVKGRKKTIVWIKE